MKTQLIALILFASASTANADSVSFSPASVSIPRGSVSQEITLRYHRQFFQTIYVATLLNMPLAQLDFVEMTRANANSQCVIKNGKLFVDYYLPNASVFPLGYSAMCKFRLRARFGATIANHQMSTTSTYADDYNGNAVTVDQHSATVTITQ